MLFAIRFNFVQFNITCWSQHMLVIILKFGFYIKEDWMLGLRTLFYSFSSIGLKDDVIISTWYQVLDATDDEPWGPHGTALAEIAQATKKLYDLAIIFL